MSVFSNTTNSIPVVTLTFSPNDLSQLEAFATLHGVSVTAFIQKAALEAASITPSKKSAVGKLNDLGALWLTDSFEATPEPETDLFAPAAAPVEVTPSAATPKPKRGVLGEQSQLAKGHGLVWEIRQALGRERVSAKGRGNNSSISDRSKSQLCILEADGRRRGERNQTVRRARLQLQIVRCITLGV